MGRPPSNLTHADASTDPWSVHADYQVAELQLVATEKRGVGSRPTNDLFPVNGIGIHVNAAKETNIFIIVRES
jgi:hypothetical protein